MAPRKVSDAPATEPRRSGRIASQPVVAAPEKTAKKPKPTKKRSAEALDEPKDESAAKKAKADSDDAAAAPADAETEVPKEEAPAPPATEAAKEEPQAPAAAAAAAEAEAEGSKDAPVSVKQLDIGDSLPALTLQNEEGGEVNVAELAAEKGVILFLVPKAATPGCTNQACGFRDIYPDFTSLNYAVYCLSADSPTAQSKWKTNQKLPYPLLSDPKRALITALGAGQDGKTKRSHFIFEKGGKLVEKKLPVSPKDSPKLALEFVKAQMVE